MSEGGNGEFDGGNSSKGSGRPVGGLMGGAIGAVEGLIGGLEKEVEKTVAEAVGEKPKDEKVTVVQAPPGGPEASQGGGPKPTVEVKPTLTPVVPVLDKAA